MVKKTNLEWRDCSEDLLRKRISEEGLEFFRPDTLVFLEGEMGSGKTTLVRILLEHLSPESRSQGSPTFPLVQTYRTPHGMPVYHMDLYRLRSADELTDSGIEDLIEEPGALVLIEWASLFEHELSFYLEHADRIRKRSVRITISGDRPESRNYRIEA